MVKMGACASLNLSFLSPLQAWIQSEMHSISSLSSSSHSRCCLASLHHLSIRFNHRLVELVILGRQREFMIQFRHEGLAAAAAATATSYHCYSILHWMSKANQQQKQHQPCPKAESFFVVLHFWKCSSSQSTHTLLDVITVGLSIIWHFWGRLAQI